MAKKSVYELQFTFEAPDLLRSEQAGRPIAQLFEEGESVIGEPYLRDNILVEERYVIPIDYVKKSDNFPYLKKESKFDETISRIRQQSVQISEKESNDLSKIGSNIKDVVEGRQKQKLNAEAKAYKNGALLGLGGGIILALYLKRSVWVFGLVGVAIGGYVAHKIQKAKQGNEKIEPITS